MEALALRLVIPPLLVVLAAVIQGRFGDRLGGLVVGLPLTSGTFLALLLPTHGSAEVAHAAVGVLAGQAGVVVLAVAYAWCAPRLSVGWTLGAAEAGWAGMALAVGAADRAWVGGGAFVIVVVVALLRWPSTHHEAGGSPAATRRTVAGRAITVAVLIAGLSALTGVLGPRLAGLLATVPFVISVVAPSTHRSQGALAVRELLRGVVSGSVAAAAFALVVATTVGVLGGAGLALATVAAGLAATVGHFVRCGQERRLPTPDEPTMGGNVLRGRRAAAA